MHRHKITRLSAVALFFMLSAVLAASAAAAPRPNRYVLPGDNVFPEGVAYQQGTQNFYVGSTGDGTIYRGNLQEPVASVFSPGGADGRTAATGMKVDDAGRLFVATGSLGKVYVYDTATGALLGSFYNGKQATFLNDIALTRNGDAYVTDSIDPTLYRVTTNAQGQLHFEAWLDLRGTPIVYGPGFNLNGIVVTEDNRYLIVVQSNTGKLFRISLATQEIQEINLGGARLTNGDGLLLRGHTLYAVQNQQALITKVRLSGDYLSGSVVSSTTDPSLAYPTTIAQADGRLLVVNSQFDKRGGQPDLPFTVSSIHIP